MNDTKQEIQLWRERAETIQVRNPEEMTAAEEVLKELRRRKKLWLEAVEKTVKSAHAAWKEAVAHRDSIAKPIDAAERVVKSRIADYVYEQRRKAEAERRRLQAEAEAKAEAERQRAIKAAQRLKTEELREQRLAEAETMVAPVVNVAPEIPETKLSTFTTWSFQIVDAAAIPREYLVPDEKRIGAIVRTLKADTNIPGIKVVARESVR